MKDRATKQGETYPNALLLDNRPALPCFVHEDGYELRGPQTIRPGRGDSEGDHRIGMTLAVAALAAEGDSRIFNPECIQTSFPDFFDLLREVAEGSPAQ